MRGILSKKFSKIGKTVKFGILGYKNAIFSKNL